MKIYLEISPHEQSRTVTQIIGCFCVCCKCAPLSKWWLWLLHSLPALKASFHCFYVSIVKQLSEMSSAARRKLFTLAMFDAITDLKYYETKLHKYISKRHNEKRENAEMLIFHFHFTFWVPERKPHKKLAEQKELWGLARIKLNVCFSFDLIKFSSRQSGGLWNSRKWASVCDERGYQTQSSLPQFNDDFSHDLIHKIKELPFPAPL